MINYELPHAPEDYVHRIGRTGRAGAEGDAISFYSPEEEKYLIDIEKLIKRKIERTAAPGFEPVAAEPHQHAGRHERSRGRFDRESPSRHARNVQVAKVEKIDPWFLKPYEAAALPAAPVNAAAAAPVNAASSGAAKPAAALMAKKGSVGALLGGAKKS